MESLRQLIVSVVGHVDHGKSSLLDKIRGSCIVETEAGKITQAIGASVVPAERIKGLCGSALEGKRFSIPGMLFIDTPGHAAFTSLRKRGGSLADMAVLVVDINEGFKPQSVEAVEILKHFKTPFVVAANKVDLIPGWVKGEGLFQPQPAGVMAQLDTKVYELVGRLFGLGFQSERFDRVTDFTKQVAIVPVSAVSGQGIPELLLVLLGLSQRFLSSRLAREEVCFGRGTILEVKEVKGLGLVLDSIIYSGCINKGDEIVLGGISGVIRSKVKALLEPLPLCEIRDKKAEFRQVDRVESAAAVRICAPKIDGAVAGMPLIAYPPGSGEAKRAEEEVSKEVSEVIAEVDGEGVVVRADSLGSIEALLKLLHEGDISVKSASVGEISKKEVCEAASNLEQNPLQAVVLGFNVLPNKDAEELAKEYGVSILTSDVIYRLIENYSQWRDGKLKEMQERELASLVQPCKIRVLPGYVFRESNPAIFGVEVLGGVLRLETPLMNASGKPISYVKSLQENKENLKELSKGKRAAISVPGIIVGRQVREGDVLFSAVPEEHFRKFKELKHLLNEEQKALLKEISEIMRRAQPLWGV